MEYLGQVKNGVVVLEGGPPLAEGTRVRVSPVLHNDHPAAAAPPGSPEAILRCTARWHGPPEEMDQLLEELRRMKWAEVEAQRQEVPESLDHPPDGTPPGRDGEASGGRG